ncbi:MAG: triose-phosphate isomerase [Candidatus Kryptonium sp.]|nr:triose-phosphate isomerase [Candidatus Kryptonium sp.]MCX7762399.1 triose-phosphate isomerase [Candidatus Kryptonium sp.]MDW8109812.1 triose-phosphate isomerase [Candidatus Kryptonium sp.]
MRKMIIAGNWKMNKDIKETFDFLLPLKNNLIGQNLNVEVVVCPPFTSLLITADLLKETKIKVGAQNMFYEVEGAYTGEISPKMLRSVRCEYVILGHSERRRYFGETDEIVNKKVKRAIEFGLKPIVCVGETLEEREAGKTFEVLEKQVKGVLDGLTYEQLKDVVIAYEPVWAIGTGRNATPEQAQEAQKFIRDLISDLFNKDVAQNLTIQYGGSVTPENAYSLLSQPDVDGALVGGASLKVDSFLKIIKAGESALLEKGV